MKQQTNLLFNVSYFYLVDSALIKSLKKNYIIINKNFLILINNSFQFNILQSIHNMLI